MSAEERVIKAKALYYEKCQTVAGEKIYKTVPDIEGILLLKVRQRREGNLIDPMWPGVAFALEAYGDEFITTFLGYEAGGGFALDGTPTPITPQDRGYITTTLKPDAKDRPGYRYVDVIDDLDKRVRVTGRWYEPWQEDKSYLKGYIKFVLDKISATAPPRYAVTFEDHIILEERALWIASSTIKVIDIQINEVLGEPTRYAWGGPPSSANPRPWLTAYKCPGHARGSGSATRKFVDQVLLSKREK